LRKVQDNEYDAVILAAAAMIRLGIEEQITEYLPVDHFTPQVGQGALAIERREDDAEVDSLLQALNHRETWHCVTAERAFLHTLGGGCSAPITALGRMDDMSLTLEGFVADHDGGTIVRATENGRIEESEEVGKRLAEKMLNMGVSTIISERESSGSR
jgi:hydroxymethylbilane synthase